MENEEMDEAEQAAANAELQAAQAEFDAAITPELIEQARQYPPATERVHDHDGVPHEHPQGNVADGYDIPPPPEVQEAVTAFLVVCMPDGTKAAFSDVDKPLKLERPATLNDMFEGAAQVQRDVQIMMMTSQVVNNTINGMMMAMQQQMEAMANQKLANQIMTPNRAQRRG